MLDLKYFDRPSSTTPYLAQATIDWGNRQDLPQYWVDKIAEARDCIDWRGAFMYVHNYYVETEEEA